MIAGNEIIVEPYDSDPTSDKTIADLFLELNQGNNFINVHRSRTELSDIIKYYIESGGNFFVAIDATADSIAGFVGLRKIIYDVGRLGRLSVMEENRKQKVGTLLVSSAVNWAQENEFSLLTAEAEKNDIEIYESLGFSLVGHAVKHGQSNMRLNLE
jgi:GNAT superfamily N-acetyltransferase